MCFNNWLTKFQKIPQSALSGQYVVDVAPAHHELAFNAPGPEAPQKSLTGKRLILEISRSYVACLEKERGRGVPLCRVSPAAPHPQAWPWPPAPGVAVGQMLGEHHRPPSDSPCTCFPGGSRRLLWRKTFSYFKCLSLQHLSAQRD